VSNIIEIQGEGARVSIEIVGFQRPNSTNVDDANWLQGNLKITLESFSCRMCIPLRTYDLSQLQVELETCLQALEGRATLRLLEPVLQVDLDFNRRGHVTVKGVAQTLGQRRSALSFSFDSDQSYLAETNRQLKAALLSFSIRPPAWDSYIS
jgi:hypothetical protein